MSWYMESSGDDRRSASDEDMGEVGAAWLGAATGVLTMKGAMLAGAAVAGPVGVTVAAIGWVGLSAVKSVWIRKAVLGKARG